MQKRIFSFLLVTGMVFSGFSCSKKATGPTKETTPLESPETEPSAGNIEYMKWTPRLNIPDPVSISFDDKGRAYVTQTQRRKAQDLDIRNNLDWIPYDVGLTSVEEKREFYKTRLSPENSAENVERVLDHNQDGSHDWRDLTVIPEVIHLVEDTDGDGFADHSQVFFDDLKTEVTGIAAGVLWHDGDVYATVAPDVWKLRDTDGDDLPDQREVIAHGFGIHIAYGGHDMHGLIVGPDGKIYWSIGDKGINVLSKEGTRFFYPNQGGVLRANPDGSDFEVFAHGLRNIQEPAFDQYGNWFGVDNDSDQAGEKERFVYIVDGMDAGWRNDYQYREGKYNPWMDEDMALPKQEDQAAYFVPAIQNYIDGPAGFVYNPGTALNERYKDYFFLNGTLNGAQYAFQVEAVGASFKMINEHNLGKGLPLIGLTWGNDGALYTVDWGGGYPLNQKGAIWKLDTPGANQALRQEVREIIEEGVGGYSDNRLQELLAHADQRLRLKAQFELVKRGETGLLIKDSNHEHRLKRIHAIWGLGQLARQDDQAAVSHLVTLLTDGDPEIQVQAAKVLGDLKPGSFDANSLIPHLGSPHPRVRFQAGLSVSRQQVTAALDAVVALLESNGNEDSYLRYAGIRALEGIGSADTLLDHSSEEVRLAAVVALRRQSSPKVAQFLADPSERVVLEAARAIHDDFSIEEALPALARLIVTTESNNEAFIRRVINANFRLGTADQAYVVAEYATNEAHEKALRLEALRALAEWTDPPLLDRVDGRRRYLDYRPKDEIAGAVEGFLESLIISEDTQILEEVVNAANNLSVHLSTGSLEKLLRNTHATSPLRVLALQSLRDPKSVTYAMNSRDVALRIAGAEFLAKINTPKAIEYLGERLGRSDSLDEKQRALKILAEFATPEADVYIRAYAHMLSEGQIEGGLQLEVIEAATQRNQSAHLAGFEKKRPKDTSIGPYIESLQGGDAEAGRNVAQNHLAAQCARCHKFGDRDGSEIGPNLRGIGGRKDREYLLRALVDPGAEVAQGYGMTTVTLQSGETISGQLAQEGSAGIELILADGNSRKIPAETIVARTAPLSSMPPMGYLLTKREIRDVVEYLSSLK